MKNHLGLFVAALIFVGSSAAMAQDDLGDSIQNTKIQAGEISDIQYMINDMEGYKIEADALYSQDGIPRVGDVSKLTNEAQDLSKSITDDSSSDQVDLIFNKVSHLKAQACSIVREQSQCQF